MNEFLEKLNKLKQTVREYISKKNLSERDRRAIIIASAAAAVFLVFLIFNGFSSGNSKNENRVIALRKQLEEIKTLRQEYEYSKKTLEDITKSIKREDEALISVVEKIMVKNQIDRNTFSIKDSNTGSSDAEGLYNESAVQVDIKRIPLEKVIDVLYAFQNRESFLKVSNLILRTKFDKSNLLDVSFRLSTFEFNKVI